MVSSSFRGTPRVKLLCALVASCFAAEGLANPTGPAVAAGAASFNTVGKTLTVTNSPNAIINWKGFSIGAGEITRFQQQGASSAVLNRVVGQDPSAILGTLSSNGKVFLVNPNGVLFGQGSRIDVAGLVASTLNITDRDFLAGRLNFQAGAVSGSIVNQGEIVSASGGRIYLIAPDVQNHGLISSPSGEVVLAAGKTVSLVDADVPNLKVEVQAGGEALNVGKIIAEGGKVGIYAGLINQRGVVRADSVSKDATGRIVFKASDTTILDEGSVTSAAGAKGGEIQVLGNKVGLAGNAVIDASGDAGGGTVLVGGDYQGKNAHVQNAALSYVGPNATITADALTSGDGGKVIVWADDATRFYGAISARGGAQIGNGGFVEVSGKNLLDFSGSANTLAPNGKVGTLLLDPSNIYIAVSQATATAAGMSGTNSSASTFSGGMFEASGAVQDSLLTTLALTGALTLNNVIVSTANPSGTGFGNITVVDPVSYAPSTGGDLKLLAHRDISVNAAISNTGFLPGAISMYAGWDGASTASPVVSGGLGSIHVNQPVSTGLFAGAVLLTAAKDINVNSTTISAAGAATLTAVSGNITVTSGAVSSSSSDVSLNAPLGAITVSNGRVLTQGDRTTTLSAATILVDNSNGSNGIYSGAAESSGTVNLTASGGITINNSTISTNGGSALAAAVTLTAGGVLAVQGASSILADTDGNATITLNGAGGVSVSGNSVVRATASNQASTLVQTTNPGAAISIADSEISAKPAFSGNNVATVSMDATGALSINGTSTIEANSNTNATVTLTAGGTLTVAGTTSPAVKAFGNNSATVSLTSTGAGVAINGDVLSDAGSSGTGTLNVSATSGAITSTGGILAVTTGGSPSIGLVARDGIGTPANPIRIGDIATLNGPVTNSGSIGDIALSGVSGGLFVIPTDDFVGYLNSNPNGTYFTQFETGDLNLGAPFTPGGAALLSGQSVIFKAPVGNITVASSGSILASGTGNVTLEAGNLLTLSGPGTQVTGNNVTFRAEDMSIGGAVTATTTATLAPFTQSRQINIESSPSGGVLSLMPSEIALVSTPGTLEIGRSDGNATMVVNTALATGNVNAGTLRLYSGNINLTTGGADIGSSGTPFAHNVELKANNDVQLTVGNIYLADNKSLTVIADNDASGFGNVNIGGVSMLVGNTGANTGSMTLQGRNINAIVSTNGGLNLRVFGTGNQTITAAGNAIFRNNNTSIGSLFVQADGGLQTITAASLELTGGSGPNTVAQIVAMSGSQSIAVGSGGLTVTGGGGTAASSNAQIQQNGSSGTQTITSSGGGDVTLIGGSGSGNSNFARINSAGTTQTVTFSSGGDLILTGGTVGNLNFADIQATNSTIGAQTQTITGATGIALTGGASGGGVDGSNNNDLGNFTRIRNVNGSQAISVGAGGITLTGGGGSLTDNFAFIQQGPAGGAPGTSQVVTINNGGALTLQGGSTAQTNVINNPANSFRGSYAQLQSNGDSQQINFTSGGAISLTGGTVGSNNAAQILSRFGMQTISGAPAITLTGGASGGYVDIAANRNEGNFANLTSQAGQSITASAVTLKGGDAGVGNHAEIFNGSSTAPQTISAANISMMGGAGGGIDSGSTASAMGNYALIQSNVGAQTITATGMSLLGGAGGQENFSSVNAPTQDITVHGNLSLAGGASVAGTLRGGGVRIGGRGGAAPGPTDLMLTVDGDLTMTGGSAAYSGAVIGTGPLIQSAQPTSITMNVGGNVTLNPGTVSNSVVYIGSFPANVSGGDISIVAGGNVTVNGGTAIRTLGTLEIDAGGALTLTGGSSGSGQSAVVFSGGDQTITANAIELTGGGSGTGASAEIGSDGTQVVNASTIDLIGGEGTQNFARIIQFGSSGPQTITATGAITMIAGGTTSNGSRNFAQIEKRGSALQHVTADSIWLEAGGGASGDRNSAAILTGTGSTASQQVDVGSGGLTLIGGTGSGGDNKAGIWVLADSSVNSNTIATQTVNVSGGGSITITGGSNAINSPSGSNNNAGIYAAATGVGSSQSVTILGTGGIELVGGESGISNHANIWSLTPSQTITAGSGGILLLGDGGTSGRNDKAFIYQEHAAGSQSITVNGGGPILALGGTGSGGQNFGQVLNDGAGLQSITFTAPGSIIFLQGGTGDIVPTALSGNIASIDAAAGSQTIAGSVAANNPSIILIGGDSGGNTGGSATLLGNNSFIRATLGSQTISAGAIDLNAGAGGVDNSATIQSPSQIITASSVTIDGGGASGSFAGARIGGIGGLTPGATNLSLTSSGDVTLTGGSVSGVSIGANSAGGVDTTITINSTSGSVILNPGGTSARIGSPAVSIGGGNIAITAASAIALNSSGALGTAIRTLGNVTLNAPTITQGASSEIISGGTTTLGGGTVSLPSALNQFGTVLLNATGNVAITDADAINFGTSTTGSGSLTVTAPGGIAQTGPIAVGGASTINAGSNPITLTNASNDFGGSVNFTGSNVSITDVNAISIGNSNATGTLNIVATSTSFLNGFSANNYAFSGGTYTLAAGTYNLGGTTTVASGATVTASGATINGAGGTLDVAGTFNASSGTVTTSTMNVTGSFNASGATLNAGTTNVSGTFNTAGGTLNIVTLNVAAGGTLSGTGTIQGNVNNLAGTVSPGASPGTLTITGNYTQGASGVLDMQIGGLVAGTDYDQLKVLGATSLAGTLNTALINGFVPVSGDSFTLIQSTGPVSGTFTTVNSPVGSLFNSFYGPTTFEFVAAASAVLPPPLVAAVNNVIVSTEQLSQPLVEVIDTIVVTYIEPVTTTTPEGQIVPKPPACN